jgi:endoglucanase
MLVVTTSLSAPILHRAAPQPRAPSLAIDVVGTHLVDGTGSVVRLLGVDRSGAEYECVYSSQVFDGPSSAASVAAIAAWHTNAVRVPLNEDCWLGINGAYRGASGTAYRQAIERYVSLLVAHGLCVILDLHWAAPGHHRALGQWPMADASHAPVFWRSVALALRSNQAVLFDLFNEPHLSSWSCWGRAARTPMTCPSCHGPVPTASRTWVGPGTRRGHPRTGAAAGGRR